MPRTILLAAAAVLACGAAARAQTTDARPARGPQSQVSVPDAAPPAGTEQTTAATDQGPKVKQMNDAEKDKVGQAGK